MTPEYRIRALEHERELHESELVRLRNSVADQRTTILFLAKMLGKAWAERDHARDIAVAAEVEVARLTGWQARG